MFKKIFILLVLTGFQLGLCASGKQGELLVIKKPEDFEGIIEKIKGLEVGKDAFDYGGHTYKLTSAVANGVSVKTVSSDCYRMNFQYDQVTSDKLNVFETCNLLHYDVPAKKTTPFVKGQDTDAIKIMKSLMCNRAFTNRIGGMSNMEAYPKTVSVFTNGWQSSFVCELDFDRAKYAELYEPASASSKQVEIFRGKILPQLCSYFVMVRKPKVS